MPIRRSRRISQQQAGYLSHCHPKAVGFENPTGQTGAGSTRSRAGLGKRKLPQMMAKVDAGMLKVPLVAEAGVGTNWEDVH